MPDVGEFLIIRSPQGHAMELQVIHYSNYQRGANACIKGILSNGDTFEFCGSSIDLSGVYTSSGGKIIG
ncbi:MAG: hypothetical protein ACYCOU_09940 [Sulfobacillus sp.]